MSKRRKYNNDFKRMVINKYLEGSISCYALGKKYFVDAKCVRSWIRLYKQFGEEYFSTNHSNINYSAAFKQMVVSRYLEGERTYLLNLFKHILAYTTNRAAPVIRQCLKRNSGSNATIKIILLRIIDIPAWAALIFGRFI